MSDFDAYQEDMERISSLSDQELDRLLAAKLDSGERDLEELAAFIRDARALYTGPPAEETASAHLAAMSDAAQCLTEGEETATPSRPRERSGHARSWRRPMRPRLVLILAGLLLLTVFAGAAYAGALPGSVQSTVADLAGNVGVTLPGDDGDGDDGDVSNVDGDDQSDILVDDQGDDDPGDDDQGDQDGDDQGDDDQGDDDQGDQGDQGDDDQGDDDQGDQDDDDQDDDDQGDQDDDDQGDDDQGDQDDGDQGDQDDGDEESGGED